MDINELLSIGIVGATLSLFIEWAKNKFGTNSTGSRILAIGLSCLVGFAYVYLRNTDLWATIVLVLSSASAVYALFFK